MLCVKLKSGFIMSHYGYININPVEGCDKGLSVSDEFTSHPQWSIANCDLEDSDELSGIDGGEIHCWWFHAATTVWLKVLEICWILTKFEPSLRERKYLVCNVGWRALMTSFKILLANWKSFHYKSSSKILESCTLNLKWFSESCAKTNL